MATTDEMRTSLEDARFFHDHLDHIVRGPQQEHDLTTIRRYFRAYLHCWKTVLHFVRVAKNLEGRKHDTAWKDWCGRWLAVFDSDHRDVFEQLRETRDHDTHRGMIAVASEVAAGLFPIVMVVPTKPPHRRRELISSTRIGLLLGERLIQEYPGVP